MFTNRDIANLIVERFGWRRELVAAEDASAQRLLDAYERIRPDIEFEIADLAAELRRRRDANLPLSPQIIADLNEYKRLLRTVDAEISDFSVILRNEMADAQTQAIETGLRGARQLALGMVSDRAAEVIAGVWVQPRPEAIVQLSNYLARDAMQQKLSVFGERAAQSIGDLVLSLSAQGKSPGFIAGRLQMWTGTPYVWAETMTRTVTNYSARSAAHAAYASNPRIVQGWVWLSAKDDRTCISCWSRDGQRYSNDQVLNDHHRGRCTAAPIVIGSTVFDDYVPGRERIEQMSEARQRQLFSNNELFDLWKRGRAGWDDLSRPYQDDVYGEMLRVATAKELR